MRDGRRCAELYEVTTYQILHAGALPGKPADLDPARVLLEQLSKGRAPSGWVQYWIGRTFEKGAVCVSALPDGDAYGVVWKSDYPEFPVGSWVRARWGSLERAMRSSLAPPLVLYRITTAAGSCPEAAKRLQQVAQAARTAVRELAPRAA